MYLLQVARNYVKSSIPLGQPVSSSDITLTLSAGTLKHEYTPHAAKEAVNDYITKKMGEWH